MSVKGRTIDNLGMDSYVRYAKDQEQIDVRLLQDSKMISRRIEVSVTKPYTPSEFDQLFSMDRTIQWALFAPPPDYEFHSQALFSYQLIPSLGGYEKQEADMDKLIAMEDSLSKQNKRKKDQSQDSEDKEEEKERKTMVALLQCIEKLDIKRSHSSMLVAISIKEDKP